MAREEDRMDNNFPPSWLVPQWIRPTPQKEKPFLLHQAALFSLYAPFFLFLVAAILAYAFAGNSELHAWAFGIFKWVFRSIVGVAFVAGVIAFLGGIKRRIVELYAYAFWGCLFNGILVIFLVVSILTDYLNGR
jgi:hypothetical protein